MVDEPKDPPKEDPPKPKDDSKKGSEKTDDVDPKLESAIRKVVEKILGEDDDEPAKGQPAGGNTRKDIEARAREEAAKAVAEVRDAEDLQRLRDKEKAAEEEAKKQKPIIPGRHRPITRLLWGGDDE